MSMTFRISRNRAGSDPDSTDVYELTGSRIGKGSDARTAVQLGTERGQSGRVRTARPEG
jgi:hypothetical protein